MKRYSNSFSVGLCGGIGSGKTSVTNRFAELGAGIIDADEVSRSLTADHQPALNLLADTFGSQILHSPGVLNRDELRTLVFNDPDKKRQLEQLLHPLIRKQMQHLAVKMEKPYFIFSIPLLIESSQQNMFDRILVVDAPIDLRIKWIKKRSGLDEHQIQQIMASQVSSHERRKHADDLIENDGSLTHLNLKVDQLHQHYMQLCKPPELKNT